MNQIEKLNCENNVLKQQNNRAHKLINAFIKKHSRSIMDIVEGNPKHRIGYDEMYNFLCEIKNELST